VEERLTALDIEVRSFTKVEDVDKATEEKKGLLERKAELKDLEARKQTALDLNEGKAPEKIKETRKDKPMSEHIGNMTREEMLALPEYRTGWVKTMMAKPMNEVEQRVWTLLAGNTGAAAAVPTVIADEIVDNMVKIAPMLDEITLFRVPGLLRFMVEGTRNAAAVHQESAPILAADDTLTQVTLSQFEFAKAYPISATIRNTSVPAFEAWLVKALAEDLAVQLENQIILGTNVTGGIENVAAWVNNANGIDYGAGLTYDNIVDLMALLPARHDRNAKFLMNKAMFFNQFAKVQDANGFPIVAKEFSAAIPYRVLGFPVIISDSVGAGNAYFGNFKRLYGNMSQDINVKASEEAGFMTNDIIYRGTVIFDCDHPDATAWRKLFT
jgi:HK97 family phage major capsid protein